MDMTTKLLEIFVFVCYATSGLSLVAFEFNPANDNGVLTACVGDHISLMCSHDNDANGVTRWIFSPPIDCSVTIDHNPPIATLPCGPFTFQDITEIRPNGLFNSTAVATASTSMTGAVAECRDSSGEVYNQIGTASICIIDQPRDLVVINVNGAHVAVWSGITCIGATINYRVEITQVNASLFTEVIMTSATEVAIPVLQPNAEYSVSVTAVTSTCFSNPAITSFVSAEFDAETSADSTQLASVGIGVGIAVVVVSIAIVTTVVVVVLLVVKLRSKPTAQLIFSNKDINQLDTKSQAIHKNQHRQSCNTYASEKEMARKNTTNEETSDCLPSLYAITVLAAPEDTDCNKTIKPKPLPRTKRSSPVNSLASPSKGPPKPPRIRPTSPNPALSESLQDKVENEAENK